MLNANFAPCRFPDEIWWLIWIVRQIWIIWAAWQESDKTQNVIAFLNFLTVLMIWHFSTAAAAKGWLRHKLPLYHSGFRIPD